MDENTQLADCGDQQETREAAIDGKVAVLIAQDGMEAHVVVSPPGPGGRAAGFDDVMASLEEAGVAFGLLLDGVEQAIAGIAPAGPDQASPILVARGKPPVDGADGHIEYHEALTAAAGRPRLMEDGRANLYDLNLVRNVPRGTVLARMTPPTPGEPGMTVQGREIRPIPGRTLWLQAGRGVSLSEDRLTVTANVDGHATLIAGKVEVTDIYEVRRDVGVETGNIQFVGSVVVRGNVMPGFSVQAGGDVDVQGRVDGGTVEARGNVTVQYGIQGGGKGRVVAGGAVKARFIENAEVRAGTNLWVTDSIYQGRVEAGGLVEVLGKRGAIIGGRVVALQSVSARNLGTSLGGATEITVGVIPSLRDELVEKRRKQGEVQANLQKVDQTLQYLADHARKGQLPKDKREMLTRLAQLHEQLFQEIESLKARCLELEGALGDARGSWVQAKDVCHPGVKVTIGPVCLVVSSPAQRSRFRVGESGGIDVVAIPGRGA